jgi:LmbE family N-acetylglucosaminyl deacetylase
MRAAAVLLLVAAAACRTRSPCDVERGRPAMKAEHGLVRGEETLAAMKLLGLHASDVFLLGYPNLGLAAIAAASTPFTDDPSGLHHTYAARGDGDRAHCDGDLRHRLDGTHSPLTATALAADLDAVLTLTQPTDVYTHAIFDGHPDHAEVSRQVGAALARSALSGTLHTTLIHPEGTGACMGPSADVWPNPPLTDGDPFRRLQPALDVTPPPIPPCDPRPRGTSWGPDGPPNELVEVPDAMQTADPDRNAKWQILSRYVSQIDCRKAADGTYHPSCGYMRAFVKRREFFWTQLYGHDHGGTAGAVLVVAAHPDDEALGAAGVIARALAAGRRVFVAVVTNGDA